MRSVFFIGTFLLFAFFGFSQMSIDGEILYGNEWIDYDKTYYKLKLADDGAYRIGYNELIEMGFPVSETTGLNIKMYRLGQQVPLFVSTNGALSTSDYIEFIGERNRGELDQYLYENGEDDQLNPEYSLFTDTTSYFLAYDNFSAGLRFEETSANNQSPNQDFYLHEESHVFSDFHLKPTFRGQDNIQYSHFDVAEGWGSDLDLLSNVTLNVENIKQTTVIKPHLKVRYGTNDYFHNMELSLNGNKEYSEVFASFATKEIDLDLEFSDLQSSNVLSLEGTNSNFDRHTMAYAKLVYPRELSFSGDYLSFIVEANPFEKILEFDVDAGDYIVVDIENNNRTAVSAINGKIKFKVEPASKERNVIIYKSDNLKTIANTSIKNFIDYSSEDPTFLFLTSSRLYDSSNPNNAIKAYADYRESTSGGGHKVTIVTSDELIDQFSYGIDRHCIGNKNFAFYVKDKWENLEYWFNIGKGIEYSAIRKADNTSATVQNNFVPTYGAPGSDVLMLSEFNTAVPQYAVGRFSGRSEQEVRDYLDKVIEFEDRDKWEQTFEDKYWMKRVLHLSGGRPTDQEIIFNGLEGMRHVIENNKYGAEVTTLRKFSDENEAASVSDRATELINNGLSIITFFGHSAPGVIDLSIEDPSQYVNYGKYPLMISLGCYSGNIHTPSFGLSEDFVIEPERAAIGFLAASGTAYIGAQSASGKNLYDYIGNLFYREPFGKAMKHLAENYATNANLEVRTLMEQFTLHADPYLNLNSHPGIDLTMDKSSVKTIPEIISPTLESFDVELDVVNIGSFMYDSVDIKVIHYGPDDQQLQEQQITIELPENKTKVSFTLTIPEISALGKNTLEFIVDPDQKITELPDPEAENNNSLKTLTNGEGYCFYILDNGISPLSPSEFGILNDNCPFELLGSTNNAFISEALYAFEIDTTELFNSPLLERGEVTSKGGLVRWTPSIEKIENTVYYWRVSNNDPQSPIGNVWSSSSFIYEAEGPSGWNQSHYYQYLKDDLQTLLVEDDRRWEYAAEIKDIRFDIGLNTENTKWIYIDGSPWSTLNQSSFGNYIGAFVFDPYQIIYFSSTNPYSQFPNDGDNFVYHLDTPESRKLLMDLMDNIPVGSRMFISTQMMNANIDWHVEDWAGDTAMFGYNLFDKFKENGIDNIDVLESLGNVPFVIAFEKGGEVIAQEYGTDINAEIEQSYKAYWNLKEGIASSTIIGPVAAWNKVEWSYSEKEDHDEISMSIYGVYPDGTEELLIENKSTEDISLDALNESNFRRCRLEINSKDSWGDGILESNRTTPQIEFLRVLYKGLPDLALVTNDTEFVYESDTLQQGKDFKIQIPILNYTAEDMGSTDIVVSVRDNQNNEYLDTIEVAAIPAKSQIISTIEVPTTNFGGDYLWNLRLNNEENPEEQYYFNNFGLGQFHVRDDKINPILDVTFDGVHINNGDVVSSNPLITACATDENPFLLLNDPNLFTIYLEDPDGNQTEIDVNGAEITFTPASGTDNKAILVYNPQNLTDGIYKLTIQTEDITGNNSGQNSFVKSFEVITRKAISNIYNYPNPFSTSTQFVFNITGDIPPESIVINIYSLSGKLVKQILPEELGPVRIGLNKSEYRWNGTDDFGQKLAAGTYLYKPIYDTYGFEQLETEGDNLFDRGFGKMVIMR